MTARGNIALATGIFALVLAVVLPFYVYPRLAVLPADPRQEQVQIATDATVLVPDPKVPAGARVVHGAGLRITTYVSAWPGAATHGRSRIWQLSTEVMVEGHGLLNARVEKVSLDRHTAQPTNCCGDRLVTSREKPDGEPLTHRGLVAWPLNVQKHSYPLWDVVLRRARTASFLGEQRRDGIRTYRFQAATGWSKVGTMELPGRLFGSAKPSVVADTEYADTRLFWVEPVTGNVIGLHEVLQQRYRYAGRTLTAISATLESPPINPALNWQTRIGALFLPWVRIRASFLLFVLGIGLLLVWGRENRLWPMRRRVHSRA
jgi:hypothetical protein